MRSLFLIAALLMSPTAQAGQISCASDGATNNREADLIKNLDSFERGLRDLKLPKEQFDRLLREGKSSMIKNYRLLAELDEHCERETNHRPR